MFCTEKGAIMKTETLVYDNLKRVIPENAQKTILFAAVGQTNYEIQFFSLLSNSNQFQQCFLLAESGELDENELDASFRKIAENIRADSHFKSDKINICTVEIDKVGVKLGFEYYDKSARIFQIKKMWKEKYLV